MLQKCGTNSQKTPTLNCDFEGELTIQIGYRHIRNCLNTKYSLSTELRITHRRVNHALFYVKDSEKKKNRKVVMRY